MCENCLENTSLPNPTYLKLNWSQLFIIEFYIEQHLTKLK